MQTIKCKWCGSEKLIRRGYSGYNNNRVFKCRNCKRNFVVLQKGGK